MKRALATLLMCTLGASAYADAPKRRIAVLEYRAGARGAPEVGTQLASQLASTSIYEVIDPAQARRTLGAGVDAEVARCSGAPACVAEIARRLNAQEVLLVGVSQLGDVVLALAARRRASRAGDRAPGRDRCRPTNHRRRTTSSIGCISSSPPRASGAMARSASSATSTARRSVSTARAAARRRCADALRVPAPGSYRVRLDKAGFDPFQARIEVPPDATVEVRATLSHGNMPVVLVQAVVRVGGRRWRCRRSRRGARHLLRHARRSDAARLHLATDEVTD